MQLYHRRSLAISTALAGIIVVIIIVAGLTAFVTISSGPTALTTTQTTSLTTQRSSSIQPTSQTAITSSSSSTSSLKTTNPSLSQASLMLDYSPASYQSIFYYGLEAGIYSANGIQLRQILPGTGGASTIVAVATEKVDFGLADIGSLTVLTSRSNISNVKAVAMIIPNTPNVVFYNKARITTPSDLNGKTWADFQGSSSGILFKIFAEKNNINVSTIKHTFASPAVYYLQVGLGQVDFATGIIGSLPPVAEIGQKSGIEVKVFPWKDYGANMLGYAIVTSTQLINNHPDIVKRFVNATMVSLLQTIKNPDASVAAMIKTNPQINSTLAILGDKLMFGIGFSANATSTSNPLTLGWIDPQRMQTTVSMIADAYGISPPPSSSLYTNQFVQKP